MDLLRALLLKAIASVDIGVGSSSISAREQIHLLATLCEGKAAEDATLGGQHGQSR